PPDYTLFPYTTLFRSRLDHGHNGIRSNEASDVIYMAVGVVAGNAGSEPDHFANAQVLGEHALVVSALHLGIALLHFAEQTFFRRSEEHTFELQSRSDL